MKEWMIGTICAGLIVIMIGVISATVYQVYFMPGLLSARSCDDVSIKLISGNVECERLSGRLIEG